MSGDKRFFARARGLAACGIVAVAGAAAVGPAGAAVESCVYNAGAKSVTANITSGSEATLKVAAGGQLLFGLVPVDCGGATTTNTDSIHVTGNAGTTERFILDQSQGFLSPGFSSESNIPEIELATNLGDASDRIVVYGTEGNDVIAAGQNGMAIDSDGDLDVTFNPGVFPLEIHALGGNDFINGRGQGGAGLHFLGPLTITGGDGNDELVGSSDPDLIHGDSGDDIVFADESADLVYGDAGNDRLTGGNGNDLLVGGAGSDWFSAGGDNDTLEADDGEADTQIHGGGGSDTAYVDANIDPAVIAVETKIVDPGPPPPPPPPTGACDYEPATKAVTAGIGAGSTATLAVVGGEILFGATPVACDGATTANTDSIRVNGAASSVEQLIVDQAGGALAPGATAETTGTSEIELSVNLGGATDVVVVRGSAAADILSAGLKGVALNNDTDVDVTFTVLPASLELAGGGGGDQLSARGGFGSGLVFPGSVTLRAGDGGDTLSGGDFNDLLVGGAGLDTIYGNAGNDDLQGAGGNDGLYGQDGNDTITGGAGADTFSGSYGNDTFHAVDGAADRQIHGGPDTDTAYVDGSLDPAPIAVEILFPA